MVTAIMQINHEFTIQIKLKISWLLQLCKLTMNLQYKLNQKYHGYGNYAN